MFQTVPFLFIYLFYFIFIFLQSTEKGKKTSHVLMTVLSGETAIQAQQMTDKEVVDKCMETLRKLFPYEVIRYSLSD